MNPEQITHVAWEAGRAYYATLGNTDFTPWNQLARAEQIQHTITVSQELAALHAGSLNPLSDDFPPTARVATTLRHNIIRALAS